jgi:YidC/Oxa1 family membrane protein insertase
MRFYQENKINPLSGCFPLLMQMPVFIALFGLLRNPQKFVPRTGRFGDLFHDICGDVASSAACTNPKGLHFLTMDLSVAPAKASEVANGFIETLPYFIMVALVIATGWYQAHQTMQRAAKNATAQTPMNTQMQLIGRVMPVAFGLISLNFATGLIVYFVTSNLWRIGQQQLVLNKMYDQAHAEQNKKVTEEKSPPPAVEKEKPPGKPASTPSEGRRERPAQSGTGGNPATPRARPNPNTAQRRKKKRKR